MKGNGSFLVAFEVKIWRGDGIDEGKTTRGKRAATEYDFLEMPFPEAICCFTPKTDPFSKLPQQLPPFPYVLADLIRKLSSRVPPVPI